MELSLWIRLCLTAWLCLSHQLIDVQRIGGGRLSEFPTLSLKQYHKDIYSTVNGEVTNNNKTQAKLVYQLTVHMVGKGYSSESMTNILVNFQWGGGRPISVAMQGQFACARVTIIGWKAGCLLGDLSQCSNKQISRKHSLKTNVKKTVFIGGWGRAQ